MPKIKHIADELVSLVSDLTKYEVCNRCHGSGFYDTPQCGRCDGSGFITKSDKPQDEISDIMRGAMESDPEAFALPRAEPHETSPYLETAMSMVTRGNPQTFEDEHGEFSEPIESPTEYFNGSIEYTPPIRPTHFEKAAERTRALQGQVKQVGNDPKGEAGAKKTPMQFIPLNALGQISHVMKLGATKYGLNNWLTSDGVGILTYKGAILRHLSAIDRGEDIDPESGQPHWAHIAACCMIILDAQANDQLIDDRVLPKPKSKP